MKFKVETFATFKCSLERAFKTPMLCDVAKVHTGYGLMPKITHTSNDQNWGKVGGTKKVYAAKSWTQKGGYVSMDKVLERVENKYWIIEVSDFQSWMLGFYKFTGKWETVQQSDNNIKIIYTYWLHSHAPIFYPLNWIFAKLFWKKYMQQVLENVRQMAYRKERYLYE